ncbi:hypothetical protein DM01DRAFT_1397612 [Hesseltinella vesiculosa]|uniref:Uncharacterized protein n=1 Tax=Hesseltinella vesiculosa TaxID=101127 RepID=A0A1X2GSQ2_9FUNG|nr:hypothetical protein DM01DRAFT_1397612 [Hesseltinella vesiculosa]
MGRKRPTQMEDTRSTTKPALTITSTEEAIEALNTQIKHFLTDQLRKHKDRDKLKADLLGKFVKLPKATTTTAKDLHWRTGTFHFMKKLQKWKKAARISDSEALLAKNAMTFCTTHDDLLARYAKTQEASAAVQAFYAAPWIGRARRFLDWHTPLVREGMVIQEQRRHKPNQLIRAIGNCGSGVGSRIGGHMRVGGKWHRRVAQRHGVSLIVNEHRTSMTCPFCGSCIMHPKKKRWSPQPGHVSVHQWFLPFGEDLYEHVWKRFPGSNMHSLARLWAAGWPSYALKTHFMTASHAMMV